MKDIRPSDVLRALRKQFGFRLDESRERGRERMVAAVQDHLGISHESAEDAVYALEHAEVVRFVHDETGDAGAPLPQGLPRGATAPAPVVARSPAGEPMSPGHWRIGEAG